MSGSRINVIGEEEFNPRTWLRREVLWASLMTPYSKQLAGWLDEDVTQKSQHSGNVSRQRTYQFEGDTEALSLSYFNQGKNIGGLISSMALFKACIDRPGEGASINTLQIQASSVDKVLDGAVLNLPGSVVSEDVVYNGCATLMKRAEAAQNGRLGRTHTLLRAGKLMTELAVQEAHSWLEVSQQDTGQSLPVLTINNGGHPRSAGDRVAMLQPIFHEIVRSEQFTSL